MSNMAEHEMNTKRDFLERICRMYYVLEMNQKDIADQLNIGRSSVARFLKEAKNEGVIRFLITSNIDNTRRTDLENQLLSKFHLKDIVVVNSNGSYEAAVANYLNSMLPYQGNVGVGWGKTIDKVGKFLNICAPRPSLKIIQMNGSVGKIEKVLPATSVIQNWAQALGATPHFLPAPAIVESKEIREFFLKDKNIHESYNEIKKVDISIVGIGTTYDDSPILKTNLVSELTSGKLQKNSVGDILLHFYDDKGRFSMKHISERVVGTKPMDFLNIPTRIALAYGAEKCEAIKGALEGRLINILITTDETAKLLLS
ncbi:hypothetical protein G8C92_00045 [Paenibacillus donghaensis]|uniref:sugar-binding transcriptional regulator n=1 Tax=Paenibacillus donghaensis TaxID=414771 RepID=UPI001883558D|nr:sugar-binding domain-containing protein [Paenibacillus donghaensis]MBE9912426.1 hypothetical protein [Paenibacillus donghaensis]